MPTYYDDNFGHWENMDDEENVEFYNHVQKTNVEKKCADCGCTVMLQPDYAICDSCANIHEGGWGI